MGSCQSTELDRCKRLLDGVVAWKEWRREITDILGISVENVYRLHCAYSEIRSTMKEHFSEERIALTRFSHYMKSQEGLKKIGNVSILNELLQRGHRRRIDATWNFFDFVYFLWSFLSLEDNMGLAQYVYECFAESIDRSLSNAAFAEVVTTISDEGLEGYHEKDQFNVIYHLNKLARFERSIHLFEFVIFFEGNNILLKPLKHLQRHLRNFFLDAAEWSRISGQRSIALTLRNEESGHVFSFKSFRDDLILHRVKPHMVKSTASSSSDQSLDQIVVPAVLRKRSTSNMIITGQLRSRSPITTTNSQKGQLKRSKRVGIDTDGVASSTNVEGEVSATATKEQMTYSDSSKAVTESSATTNGRLLTGSKAKVRKSSTLRGSQLRISFERDPEAEAGDDDNHASNEDDDDSCGHNNDNDSLADQSMSRRHSYNGFLSRRGPRRSQSRSADRKLSSSDVVKGVGSTSSADIQNMEGTLCVLIFNLVVDKKQ